MIKTPFVTKSSATARGQVKRWITAFWNVTFLTHVFHAILNTALGAGLAINKTKFAYIIPIKAMSKFIINSFSNRPSLQHSFINIHSTESNRHVPQNKMIMRQFRMASILSGGKIPNFLSKIMVSSKNLTQTFKKFLYIFFFNSVRRTV